MAFCGTLGHGSVVDFVVLSYWLDLMILGFFSNLIDSVIQFYDVPLMYGSLQKPSVVLSHSSSLEVRTAIH